jgi:hypothetical protein
MIYPKDNPMNLNNIYLMTVYGDGLIYNALNAYYAPKKYGASSSVLNAANVVIKGSVSTALSLTLDTISKNLFRSTRASEIVYSNRFIDELVRPIEGEVKIEKKDGEILQYDKRTFTLLSTIGIGPYGIKPIDDMPSKAEEFKAYFPAGVPPNPGLLNPCDYTFQLLGGNVTALEFLKAFPKTLVRKKITGQGMFNVEAKKVEINQQEPLRFIKDGTRHPEPLDGNNVVIEVAYMQPFILLEQEPAA